MWKDYKDDIFAFYGQKKENGALTSRLRQGSPALLRDECLFMWRNKYNRKDERALMDFFELEVIDNSFEDTVINFEIDKFKQLSKCLKKPSIDTDEKNVELLAWLIEFEPRPYDIYKKRKNSIATTISPEPKEVESPDTSANPKENKDTEGQAPLPFVSPVSPKQHPKSFTKKVLIAAAAAIVIATFIFILIRITLAEQSCMYWNGDRYVKISCNEHMSQAQVIALDTQVLRHFKRITTPDTITLKSVGAVWYIKQNGQLQFFTAEGNHPTDPNIHLRPVTDYIIRKYIHPLSDTTK